MFFWSAATPHQENRPYFGNTCLGKQLRLTNGIGRMAARRCDVLTSYDVESRATGRV
jgi:hypothetical protein